MELNKCSRCGAFFTTNTNVCPNCEPQDKFEMAKLKDFIQENITETTNPYSTEQLACYTGISQKNINRFINQDASLSGIIGTNTSNQNVRNGCTSKYIRYYKLI